MKIIYNFGIKIRRQIMMKMILNNHKTNPEILLGQLINYIHSRMREFHHKNKLEVQIIIQD